MRYFCHDLLVNSRIFILFKPNKINRIIYILFFGIKYVNKSKYIGDLDDF